MYTPDPAKGFIYRVLGCGLRGQDAVGDLLPLRNVRGLRLSRQGPDTTPFQDSQAHSQTE